MKIKKITEVLAVAGVMFVTGASQHAYGQADKTGNGGNSVVCFDDSKIADILVRRGEKVGKTIPDEYLNHITSIQTLDLYNAGKTTGLTPVAPHLMTPINGETIEEFASRVSKRITLDPFKARADFLDNNRRNKFIPLDEVFALGESSFHDRIEVSMDAGVFPADDIEPLTLAKTGCIYTTMAVQRAVGNNGKRELKIDGRLFYHPKHSIQSQAALFLHESYLAAAINLSGDAPIGKTEGVQELVSSLLHFDTSFGDILELVNRRQLFRSLMGEESSLFSAVEYRNLEQVAYWPEMEDLIKKTDQDLLLFRAQAKSKYKAETLELLRPVFEKLPTWYTEKMSLEVFYIKGAPQCLDISRKSWLDPGLISSKEKCVSSSLIDDAQVIFRNIDTKIQIEITKNINSAFISRSSAYQALFDQLKNKVRVSSAAIDHLNQLLSPIIESGIVPNYFFDKGQNGMISIDLKEKRVWIGLDAKGVSSL